MSSISRRRLLIGAAAGTAAAAVGYSRVWPLLRQPRARVTTLKAASYDIDLVDLLVRAVGEYPRTVARAKGARVVLKPNLVEWDPKRPINTDPRLVAAVAEVFRHFGASEVVVAEGPGHRRDSELIVEQSGLRDVLDQLRLAFVDLNMDTPRRTSLPTNYTGLGHLELARTATTADLLVSLPKMKTHHWAGATLSMKNLFGIVPGVVYGWPKNPLHWAGIEQSILDIWAAVRPHFAIVDGIVAMDGDGPLRGDPVAMGTLVLGEQLPAIDATCTRLMKFAPERMEYLAVATRYGGTVSASRIDIEGDVITPYDFKVRPHLQHLKAG